MTKDAPPQCTISPAKFLTPSISNGLSVEDRLAIYELIARNYLVEDTRDEMHLAAIVTEDFRQEHPLFGATESRDGLAALLRDNPTLFDGIRHQALNVVAAGIDDEAAEAVHYIMVTQVHAIGDVPSAPLPRIIGHGVVRDQLVKQGGRWLIHRRVYEQMSIAPDMVPEAQRLVAAQRLTADWDAA